MAAFSDPINLETIRMVFERALLDEILRRNGHDPEALRARSDPDARHVLAQAARQVSARLSEIEARARYVRELHG
jgi:hypothetical protein